MVEDLRSWVPRVKDGGWVAGHDYSSLWPGVAHAVNLLRQGRELWLGMDHMWWFRKDKFDDERVEVLWPSS